MEQTVLKKVNALLMLKAKLLAQLKELMVILPLIRILQHLGQDNPLMIQFQLLLIMYLCIYVFMQFQFKISIGFKVQLINSINSIQLINVPQMDLNVYPWLAIHHMQSRRKFLDQDIMLLVVKVELIVFLCSIQLQVPLLMEFAILFTQCSLPIRINTLFNLCPQTANQILRLELLLAHVLIILVNRAAKGTANCVTIATFDDKKYTVCQPKGKKLLQVNQVPQLRYLPQNELIHQQVECLDKEMYVFETDPPQTIIQHLLIRVQIINFYILCILKYKMN
ncbi:unnamed protein product [Paramecium octaurelia]|uniref:Transmembrane protein n=1 Tax=Paramecium octaurelia TaxID=43137 RepID=A0A8S1Y6I8_PAROT|nr:unnamed protein product [Paramecium octaurelia]